MKVLVPELLRELTVNLLDHPRGETWLSAASGLICVGEWAYVIADDEHHLGCFSLRSILMPGKVEPLSLVRLFSGDLPDVKQERKKLKPDLESLSLLPPLPGFAHGALLAMGSGSKANRRQAVLIPLDAAGRLSSGIVQLGLEALYAPLQKQLTDLNIEGAFVAGEEFHLLHRGNKSRADSAHITYSWPAVAAWLSGPGYRSPVATSISQLSIGSIGGVPVSITDAAALHAGSWIFCAVAENTDDSYHDGACLASIIGIVDARGELAEQYRLQGDPKVEGVAVMRAGVGDGLQLLLVTDADDPKIASQLLRVVLPPF